MKTENIKHYLINKIKKTILFPKKLFYFSCQDNISNFL